MYVYEHSQTFDIQADSITVVANVGISFGEMIFMHMFLLLGWIIIYVVVLVSEYNFLRHADI